MAIENDEAATPRRRRKEARPGEIIEAGLAEFAARGFAAAKLDDVARRAGIAKGTIYRYFASKEALFEAAVLSLEAPLAGEVERMIDAFPGPAADLLRLVIGEMYARLFQPELQTLMQIIISEGGRHPAYREEDGQRVMKQSEITVRVDLHRGAAETTLWTCDLSHDYVSINADYRS